MGARAYVRERAALRDLCRTFRPDVVHTHGPRTDVVDRSVASSLGIPTVTTVHGPSMNGGLKGAVYEAVQRANYRRFDAVVAVSRALHETTLAGGVPADRLHLIPNAWGGLRAPLPRAEARRALGLEPDATVIGWVGRLLNVKGGDVFLNALARLPEPRPSVALIGQGEEEATLRALATRLGLDGTVRFHTDVVDAGRYFSAFDVYVLSSRSEGLPIVLLEAMAARAPIVATAVGGVPEAVGAGEALLVAPEDPAALAQAIGASLKDPEAALLRAQHAAERLERQFSLRPWLEQYEAVYGAVIEGAARRA